MEASRQPLGTEVGAVYTMDMKQVGKHIVGETNGVSIPRQEFDYIVLHNHPDCGTFSFGDLDSFSRRDTLKILVALGNDGSIFLLEKTNEFDSDLFNNLLGNAKSSERWKESLQMYSNIVDSFLQGVDKCGISYKKIEP